MSDFIDPLKPEMSMFPMLSLTYGKIKYSGDTLELLVSSFEGDILKVGLVLEEVLLVEHLPPRVLTLEPRLHPLPLLNGVDGVIVEGSLLVSFFNCSLKIERKFSGFFNSAFIF